MEDLAIILLPASAFPVLGPESRLSGIDPIADMVAASDFWEKLELKLVSP